MPRPCGGAVPWDSQGINPTDLEQDHAHDGQWATHNTADFEAIGLSLINP